MIRFKAMSAVVRHLCALFAVLALQVLLAPAAMAQSGHTSTLCAAKTATVASGGTVTIDVTDCAFNSGFYASGSVDGGSFGTPDFPNHGTANLRITSGRWFVDYSHNGSTGIGSTDTFEFQDGSLTGCCDTLVTITITASASPISVLPSTLPTMTAGTPFSQTLTASGGLAPYTYTLQSGSLPVGLSMSGGVISGTPTQRGPYTFSVRATDSTSPTGQFVDKGYTGNVQIPTLALSPSSATVVQGVATSFNLNAAGGVPPYTYMVEPTPGNAMPPGLSISSAGVVSGTPTSSGTFTTTLRVGESSTGPGTVFELETLTINVLATAPTVSITVSPASVSEDGVTNLTYVVTRSLALSTPTVVNLTTSGTATSGSDYTGGVTSVTIPANAAQATVVIDPTADTTTEPDETVTLTVAAGSGYTVGASPSATATIANDDLGATVSIAVSPASVNEDGVTNLVYTVTRSAASASALTVNLSYSGTATSGADYTGALSSITIPANATSATLSIDPTADATVEPNETVIVTVASGSGYTAGSPSSATGTITNDEGTSIYCPTLLATVAWGGSVSINAGSCNAGFGLGVVRSAPTHGTATVGTFGVNQPIIYSHNGTSGTTDTFTVSDGEAPPNDQIRVNITITPPTSSIVVNPAALPAIQSGIPFSQTLTATGGTGPYTYTLAAGTLPPGLSLSSGGVVSGTATQRGSYDFTVRAQDSTGAFTNKGYSGTVGVAPLSITPASATAGQGQPFTLNIVASGGVAPYSFLHESAAGPLPPGMTISSTGVLSGTPTTIGTTVFQMRVTDSSTGPGSYFELENFSFTVQALPTVSIAVSPASVSEDGATNLTYTVTRSAASASPLTVNLANSGTATSGSDYTGAVASVTIPAGATTATFTIDPSVDGTVEPDETVIFTVAAGTGYTVGAPASATGTILNDDVPTATITVAPAAVAEDGAPNLVFTVTLNQANPSAATAIGYTIGGTATNGTDYATIASPLVIPAGSTTGTITVNPTADTSIEPDETVTLTLNAGAGYTVGVPNAATGTILNDDLPNLTINDVTVNEGNSGVTNVAFTVSLSAPAGPGGVTFNIATANGSAAAGSDYVAQSLNAQTIPAGSSSYVFTVQLNGDALNEPSETFFVNVTSVINAVVVDGQGVGTIVNDDPLPSLSINDVTVVEGNAGTVNAVFTVTLNAASGQTVAVNYATADGTATQPADYTATSGTLIFPIGTTSQTITVPVAGEAVPETNESFFVNLSGATNATISDNQGLGTITNDDVPVTVSPAALPNATAGVAYSQSVTASGGTGPYSFAVTAGALPAGLSLTSGGILAGAPTATGSFNFTVTATDASAAPGPFSGNRAYTLTVSPPALLLPATTLPDGTRGTPYAASLTAASGGTEPYAYAITAGALPAGLTLDAASGAITGTPGAFGTFNFSVTATDSTTGTGPFSVTQTYAVTVTDIVATPGASALSVAYNAPATNVPLSISGGTPTSLTITTAPAHGTAIVTGTTITYQPASGYAGADSFAYTATNSGGTSTPATVTITVQNPVITITPTGGFNATAAAPYTQTFTFNGGSQPWSGYQVTNLPTGLAITGTTANTVTVSGTPIQAGSFNLNVSATDSSTGNGPFTVGQAFTLSVAPPVLTMTPAAGTFTAAYAAPYSQAFSASGGVGPYGYTVTGTLPAGLSMAGDTISGTPTAPGSYPITITATDQTVTGPGAPYGVSQNYILNVPAPVITITPATLASATVGASYSQSLSATGGAGTHSVAITAGTLPAGLTLSGGTIAGTPTQAGTFALTVTATDANGQTGSRAYNLTVAAPVLALAPTSGALPITYATAFSRSFAASGGTGPYSYTLAGTLPAGLTFDAAAGTVAGTPTVSGNFSFGITATDTGTTGLGAPFSVSGSYTLAIAAPTITVTPDPLPEVIAGQAYSVSLAGAGAVAPYSFSLSSGTLPAGVTLSATGQLAGTPTASGAFPITVLVRDANGQQSPVNLTLNVGVPTLTVTPASLPAANFGIAYSQQLTATGGIAPYSYTISTGTLPTGMTLNSTTGLLSGTPTVAGAFPFAVTVRDSTGGTAATVTVEFTLQVQERPDPARDPEVRGLVQAQAEATKRFATTQINNFQQRLERLHEGSDGDGNGESRISVTNSVRISVPDVCRDAIVMANSARCARQRDGLSQLSGLGSYSEAGVAGVGSGIPSGIAGTPTAGSGGGVTATGEATQSAAPKSAAGGSGSTTGSWGIWTAGLIRFGDQEAGAGRGSYEFESEGVTIGADYRFSGSFAAGLGFGFGRDTADIGENGSRSRGEAKTVAAYASFLPGGNVFIDGLIGYQWLDFDLRRYVTSTGRLIDSQRKGHQWFGSVSLGADLARGKWQMTPYARLDLSRARLNGYTESSGSVFDLTFLDQTVDSTSLGLGTRIRYTHNLGWGRLYPELRGEYQWQLDRNGDILVTYADRLAGPYSAIRLAALDRDELTLGGKLDLELNSGWLFGLEYIGRFASGAGSDSTIKIVVGHEF